MLPLQKLRRLSSGAFASVSLVLLVTAAAYGQIPEPDFSHDIPFEEIPAFLAQFDWVLYVALAGMVATILLLALLGVGNSRAKARAGVEHGPQLPDELRAVAILGARYRLETFSGPVASVKTVVQVETTVETTGGVYSTGNLPWSTTTTVRSTQYDTVWLRDTNGGEAAWVFTNASFPVAAGQAVSLVTRANRRGKFEIVLAYNHASGQLVRFAMGGIHRIPGLISWLAATAVGVGVFYWAWPRFVAALIAAVPENQAWIETLSFSATPFLAMFTGMSAVLALLPAVVSSLLVIQLRNRVFMARFLPGIRAFLQSKTSALRAAAENASRIPSH